MGAGGECGVVYNQRQRMPQQPGWDSPTLNANASGANLRLYYSFEYGARCCRSTASDRLSIAGPRERQGRVRAGAGHSICAWERGRSLGTKWCCELLMTVAGAILVG